jgi:hypothetical protein
MKRRRPAVEDEDSELGSTISFDKYICHHYSFLSSLPSVY